MQQSSMSRTALFRTTACRRVWLRSHVADHAAGVARDKRFGSNDAHLVNQKMAKIGRMQSWI
ncbi:hypothetical protein XI07_34150 [Bradyrhizobium sp. CCBAU 11445]|uniref:Uncharacterized protein n=1 Tax=Bradyrhizobium ottawaense TaxID=931866 RepID=A0A2U8P2K5_9BRAD|nr:hypothetical protein CIT37_06905 [Bradyrhizobium ottawaense]MDA9447496.1 hypothetical protein [Bradyrhizobium sp. CCBAU 21360]MDA9487014.1 hypothetical protein [Bradyrhizobium sp. CCBAU 11445]